MRGLCGSVCFVDETVLWMKPIQVNNIFSKNEFILVFFNPLFY